MQRTIMTVFGTRPEAIKMMPVVKALEASPDFKSVVVVTHNTGKCWIKS